jgi:SH3-like domain-containing protein
LARLVLGGAVCAAILIALVGTDARVMEARVRRDASGDPKGLALGEGSAPPGQPKTSAIETLLGDGAPARTSEVTGSLPRPESSAVGLGPVSGLPMPRFVSLKTDRVNVRQGPTRGQEVSFIFQKAGLPVEVTAEFENWRRIRDCEGSEGWVQQSLLSGRRTALVAPWSKTAALRLYARADTAASTVALLQPGVFASIKNCATNWCRIAGPGFDGYIEQQKLWGAYPGESIN